MSLLTVVRTNSRHTSLETICIIGLFEGVDVVPNLDFGRGDANVDSHSASHKAKWKGNTSMITNSLTLKASPRLPNNRHRDAMALDANVFNCVVRDSGVSTEVLAMLFIANKKHQGVCFTNCGKIRLSILNGLCDLLYHNHDGIVIDLVERNSEQRIFRVRQFRREILIVGPAKFISRLFVAQMLVLQFLNQKSCALSNRKNAAEPIFSGHPSGDHMLLKSGPFLHLRDDESGRDSRDRTDGLNPSWPTFFIKSEIVSDHPDCYQDGESTEGRSANFSHLLMQFPFRKES
ncbi:MAG: hypothetical protein JWM30_3471 [Burkholderia sp.]|nr:hypothetical protein [Burkholderia sp.]